MSALPTGRWGCSIVGWRRGVLWGCRKLTFLTPIKMISFQGIAMAMPEHHHQHGNAAEGAVRRFQLLGGAVTCPGAAGW